MFDCVATDRQAAAATTGVPIFAFVGGAIGEWRVERIATVRGAALALAPRLAVVPASLPFAAPAEAAWALRGAVGNLRYTTAAERDRLAARQPVLGRAAATRAALIPIRKSAAWWALAQDERRAVFEEHAHHIAIGLEYLPAVARRLHHCREIGEPFDFLTWFEYAPADEQAFDELVARLRASAEWAYVEREVDVRLRRE